MHMTLSMQHTIERWDLAVNATLLSCDTLSFQNFKQITSVEFDYLPTSMPAYLARRGIGGDPHRSQRFDSNGKQFDLVRLTSKTRRAADCATVLRRDWRWTTPEQLV